ncbi:DUF2020 domain-containing protein [Corynebacterium falsenii]
MVFSDFRRRHVTHVAATALTACCGVVMLTGCSSFGSDSGSDPGADTQAQQPADPATEQTFPPVRGTELPIDATVDPVPAGQPAGTTSCPYIDSTWLENTTGQRFTGVGLDERFDPPACVFWSYEDVPQATVLVRHMTTNKDAVAVVDFHASIDSTLKALQPEGWSGGRRGGNTDDGTPGASGAIYAVWKGPTAVVVHTAQDQSVKAQQIAEETIRNLNL